MLEVHCKIGTLFMYPGISGADWWIESERMSRELNNKRINEINIYGLANGQYLAKIHEVFAVVPSYRQIPDNFKLCMI